MRIKLYKILPPLAKSYPIIVSLIYKKSNLLIYIKNFLFYDTIWVWEIYLGANFCIFVLRSCTKILRSKLSNSLGIVGFKILNSKPDIGSKD